MKTKIGKNLIIDEKYSRLELSAKAYKSIMSLDNDELIAYLTGFIPTTIYIMGNKYDAIPDYIVARSKNRDDGYYRFIYIQINLITGEYYIGKVNRPKYSIIKKYQGSGLKFLNKYNKHKDVFQRYYIYQCKTAKETAE